MWRRAGLEVEGRPSPPGPPSHQARLSSPGLRLASRSLLPPPFLPPAALLTPGRSEVRACQELSAADAGRALPPVGGDGVCPNDKGDDCFLNYPRNSGRMF